MGATGESGRNNSRILLSWLRRSVLLGGARLLSRSCSRLAGPRRNSPGDRSRSRSFLNNALRSFSLPRKEENVDRQAKCKEYNREDGCRTAQEIGCSTHS